jgi:hypothetical protein
VEFASVLVFTCRSSKCTKVFIKSKLLQFPVENIPLYQFVQKSCFQDKSNAVRFLPRACSVSSLIMSSISGPSRCHAHRGWVTHCRQSSLPHCERTRSDKVLGGSCQLNCGPHLPDPGDSRPTGPDHRHSVYRWR